MDIATVTRDIESWITNFLEVPHPVLGGFPPCPYARSARLKQSYAIVLGTDPLQDLKIRADLGLQGREVWIYDRVTSSVRATAANGPLTLFVGGSAAAAERSQSTLTIIVKFDKAGKVRDLAYHTSKF